MKNNLTEALDRMKFLTEFTYKTNHLDTVEENPVKFNEIGDKYKNKPKSDYPEYSQYLDEVILDEEGEDDENNPQQPQNQGQPQTPEVPAQAPQPDTTQQQQPPVDQSHQMPVAQPDMQPQAPASMQDTSMQQPQVPIEPAPQPTTDLGSTGMNTELDAKLAAQMAKTDELLLKISDMDQKLSAVDNVSAQLSHVAQEVESIKNPSLDDQLEMISKQSYPYNVKLSDYWKWDENQEDEKPEEFSATPGELNSFNKDDIRKSLNV